MTIEIRTWHGWEDGSDDIRLHARWRYLEAFWNADIFAYTGHSHFGHGPLEPWEYSVLASTSAEGQLVLSRRAG
jgi:hypothetical protein